MLAGVVLLAFARMQGLRLRTDMPLALFLGLFPFALSYGLVYWGEQYIPSGLAAVLFGVMPIYVALLVVPLVPEERITPRLIVGLVIALGGLVVAFGESLSLGEGDRAAAGAAALTIAPLAAAAGNVALKRRSARLEAVALNGWAMLAGGLMLLVAGAPFEDWGQARWTGQAAGAIVYLAIIGSAIPFTILTVLLRKTSVTTMSTLPLMLPFGALVFGAALYDEEITLLALAGAVLVAAGLVLGTWSRPPAAAPSPDAATAG